VEVRAISSGISFESFNPTGNVDAIRKKYSIPAKPILLYVGRLDPEKHIEEILKAVAIAAQTHDFCFVVVGKGTSKITLMKQAKQLGINDKVIFTGYVPDEDIPALYKASRCFIIASIAELLSLSTIQGMASGLPVIAVQAGALVELVSQGENGYLFHEGDIRAIAQYIINIVSDEVLFRNMSKRSLEIVQSHDIRKTLKDFENLYMEQAAPRFNLVENI
jgi:glycosyltransferase involved in cell wall biosynthesis